MAITIIDETMLREPNLYFHAKKPLSYRLDTQYTLCPTVGCWMFDNPYYGRNLVTGYKGSTGPLSAGRSFGVDTFGRYLTYYARDEDNYIPTGPLKQTTGTFTFEWFAQYPSTYSALTGTDNLSVYLFDIQTDRFLIGHNAAAPISFYDGAWTSTGYEPCGVSGYQHFIFVFDGTAGTATLWVNGLQKYSAATYTARSFTTTNGKLMGRYAVIPASPYNPVGQKLQFLCIHNHALSAGEVASRTADPYQFMIPA